MFTGMNLSNKNTSGFGAPTTTTQFSFGSSTPQQQPQASGIQFNSTFNKPTGSVAPQVGGFSFGTPASTTSTGFGLAPSSAAASTTGTSLTFGAASTAPSGFGLTTSTTPGLTFGAPSSNTTTGFSLGAPAASSAPGLSFGTPASTTTALNFGTPASSTITSLGTGIGTTVSSGLNLGGATTGLNFGAPTTNPASTSGFSLGNAPSTTATPTLNFGTSTTGSILTSTPSTGLTFGAASTAPTLNFGLSTSTSAAPGGLTFGAAPASTGFSLTSTSSTVPVPDKVGLGGIQTTTSTSLGSSTAKEVPPKDQQVPNEIQQDIENFKNYIKQQKLYSSDVSRCCVKDFRSVEAQIGVLNNVIKEIETQLQRNRSLAEKLKYDTAQGLQLLEMAQRTQDTPAGLQYENVAPMNFFLSLADKFEKEMHALKIQIENTDKYVKNFGQPATLTSQDLSLGMKRLHDTFVALAGRLQSVHTQVESQKELYINLRRQLANDSSNPFEALDKKSNLNQAVTMPIPHSPPKIACGPTPFNQIINSNFPIASQQGNSSTGMSASNSGFGMASSTLPSLLGNLNSLNKTTPAFGSGVAFQVQNTSITSGFQLQKPPTGNKRGKQ